MIILILKIVIVWLLIGLLFDLIAEGFPNPNERMTRWRKRIMMFDTLLGPVAVTIFLFLVIRKLFYNE